MSLIYRVGQTVEVAVPRMGKPIGYQFVVKQRVTHEDPEFGAGYYVGEGFRRGIWEAFVRAAPTSSTLGSGDD